VPKGSSNLTRRSQMIIPLSTAMSAVKIMVILQSFINTIVGCELQETFQPTLDESLVSTRPFLNPHSVVTGQPSVSELVNIAMTTSKHHAAEQLLRDFNTELDNTGIFDASSDLECAGERAGRDFKHSALLQRKRKFPAKDGFSDVEIEDIDLDEDELKKLDFVGPPQESSDTRTRCKHVCKDRMKYVYLTESY